MVDENRLNLVGMKSCLLSPSVNQPVVFHGLISSWPAMQWSPMQLTNIFTDQTFKFRLGRKYSDDVQWETNCCYEYATVSEFLEWTEGHCNPGNPLVAYGQDTYWCYADYIHMHNLFDSQPEMLKCVDWAALGFDGRDGRQSTFWMGTEGAYTVCHFDTYGCNLVAQIHGRKKWVMFPPADSEYLYPTRVPYEESSVFSLVNIHNPDFVKHPRFKNVTPYIVTLAPGDVLFLPRHWWHLVESLDTTVSINSWIDMEEDSTERLQEAVVRTMMFALMSQEPHLPLDSWLNPTEDLSSHQECMELLNNSVDALTLVTRDRVSVTSTDKQDMKHSRDTAAGDAVASTGVDDATTLLCINGKRCNSTDQQTAAWKRSRTCEQSHPGHHDTYNQSYPDHHDTCDQSHPGHFDTLQHCHKCTVIANEEFNRRHVERLESCSLEDYLSASLTSRSCQLHGDEGAVSFALSTQATTASEQTCTVYSDTPGNAGSTDRQKKFIGEVRDSGSCHALDNRDKTVGGKRRSVTTTDLVDCVVHPDVVALICQKIRDKLDTT